MINKTTSITTSPSSDSGITSASLSLTSASSRRTSSASESSLANPHDLITRAISCIKTTPTQDFTEIAKALAPVTQFNEFAQFFANDIPQLIRQIFIHLQTQNIERVQTCLEQFIAKIPQSYDQQKTYAITQAQAGNYLPVVKLILLNHAPRTTQHADSTQDAYNNLEQNTALLNQLSLALENKTNAANLSSFLYKTVPTFRNCDTEASLLYYMKAITTDVTMATALKDILNRYSEDILNVLEVLYLQAASSPAKAATIKKALEAHLQTHLTEDQFKDQGQALITLICETDFIAPIDNIRNAIKQIIEQIAHPSELKNFIHELDACETINAAKALFLKLINQNPKLRNNQAFILKIFNLVRQHTEDHFFVIEALNEAEQIEAASGPQAPSTLATVAQYTQSATQALSNYMEGDTNYGLGKETCISLPAEKAHSLIMQASFTTETKEQITLLTSAFDLMFPAQSMSEVI